MKTSTILLFLFFGIYANSPTTSYELKISGHISNPLENEKIILMKESDYYKRDNWIVSEVSSNGKFELNATILSTGFYVIRLRKTPFQILVFINRNTKSIELTIKDNISYSIKGNDELKGFNDLLIFEEQLDNRMSMSKDFKTLQEKKTKALKSITNEKSSNQIKEQYIKDLSELSKKAMENEKLKMGELIGFANTKLNKSEAVCYLINRYRYSTPLNESLIKLIAQIPINEYNKQLLKKTKDRITKLQNIAIGKKAPNIILADSTGKITSLNSLKGKYVLIDFWSSGCVPCREEFPFIKKQYSLYKKLGFEVYAINIYDKKEFWKKAIKKDNTPWIHVIDIDKEIASQYSINSMPSNFLLNPDGIIIGKAIRGKFLEEALKKAFEN